MKELLVLVGLVAVIVWLAHRDRVPAAATDAATTLAGGATTLALPDVPCLCGMTVR